jgi:hypothetical protein
MAYTATERNIAGTTVETISQDFLDFIAVHVIMKHISMSPYEYINKRNGPRPRLLRFLRSYDNTNEHKMLLVVFTNPNRFF